MPATRTDPPPLVVSFPDAASAERVIAGLPVAARAVAEAVQAGLRDIRLVIGEGQLSPALQAEIARVRQAAQVKILASHEADDRVLWVNGAETLLTRAGIERRLAGGDAAALPGDTIDLRHGWAATRAVLRGTAKAGDGLVSRWLNRPISQFISAMTLLIPGVRPWHASVGAALTGLLMAAALLFGGRTGLIAGGILFHAASVIDGVDGEIARATYRSSRSGAILDTTIDMLTNLAFFVCITVSLTRLYGVSHLYVGVWLVVWAAIGLVAMRALAVRAGEPGNFNILKRYYTRQFPTGIPALIREALIILTSRDMFAFVFAVNIVIGLASATFYSLGGFVTLWVILIAAAAPGLLREPPSGYSSAAA